MKKRCARKMSYPTLQAAQAAAAGFARRASIVTFLRAYRCSCGQHHVGRTKTIDWSKVK